jgi:acetyl-CoA carboxylase biotin carboxylase subunit
VSAAPAAKPLFKKVLVANRGEIAIRVIRACHELGIPTVAVYSEADRDALHVRHADEAVCLGEPAPLKSYLDQDKVVAAAKATGAEAIHPGYGFLSENASFARRCRDEGLVFVGPTPEAIYAMGDKVRSRELMAKAGVPLVPGVNDVTRENLFEAADKVGYPLLLKASAGGGGKGIRAVRSKDELLSSFERAQGEAGKSFGDAKVFIERLVDQPHHIEVQVIGDAQGNLVHLFERECSTQRRHQKVVEETPSPFLTPEVRAKICAAAVEAARAVQYRNAGTVEFIMGGDRKFYFLEMNTRLQVEHPVTELVTGVDLVVEQLRVAAGLPLSFRQEDVVQRGHAIECRICAEDPEENYAPSVGVVEGLALPGGPSVRLDSALFAGLEVALHYDSMLAKLCTWGRDRDEAAGRMRQALSEFKVGGVRTNLAQLARILRDREFKSGAYDTGLLTRMTHGEAPAETTRLVILAAALLAHEQDEALERRLTAAHEAGGGGRADAWRLSGRPGLERLR